MDPITQGALGGAVVQAALGPKLGRKAWVLGAVSGMAPDLDVLVRSPSDPLVAIEYHRHFTHALAFAPVGGLLVALPFILWARRARARGQDVGWTTGWIIAACVLGWLTHAPLDCCTSYGTLFLWPFSQARVALDVLPIVDLLYTVPLIVGLTLARRHGRRAVIAGLIAAHVYAGLCVLQDARARGVQAALMAERGHPGTAPRTIPYIGSNVIWRSIYEHEGRLYADMIVTPWFGSPTVLDGRSVPLIREASQLPAAWREHPRRADVFALMRWFSGDRVGVVEDEDGPALCDLRLSTHPVGTTPVICLGATAPLSVKRFRPSPLTLLDAVFRRDPRQRAVGADAP